ncbi:acyl-CoA N-acyltransferase [Clohesyomyces aquaticus]|uniref:Acyl-CoA N-acyltransferase n=1 Tax=Clohesyomyces aquaticus TaxID=1231657 RepID=A0A1Y1ZPJ7_9PLEO|nr:acyl-CoA N-acyltransferase [Clohesyomyces aquaticus]
MFEFTSHAHSVYELRNRPGGLQPNCLFTPPQKSSPSHIAPKPPSRSTTPVSPPSRSTSPFFNIFHPTTPLSTPTSSARSYNGSLSFDLKEPRFSLQEFPFPSPEVEEITTPEPEPEPRPTKQDLAETPLPNHNPSTAYSQNATLSFPNYQPSAPLLLKTQTLVLQIKLLPFTHEDALPAAHMYARAFSTDVLQNAMFPPSPSTSDHDVTQELHWRTSIYQRALQLPTLHHVKAVDSTTGQLIGAAGYFGPGGLQWQVPADADDALPENCNRDVRDTVTAVMREKRESVLKGDYNVWELSQAFVDPSYQRRGVGRLLLEWGIQLADSAGYPLYLEGTPSGKLLYEQFGFEIKAEAEFPEIIEDGEPYRYYFMIRRSGGRGVQV